MDSIDIGNENENSKKFLFSFNKDYDLNQPKTMKISIGNKQKNDMHNRLIDNCQDLISSLSIFN